MWPAAGAVDRGLNRRRHMAARSLLGHAGAADPRARSRAAAVGVARSVPHPPDRPARGSYDGGRRADPALHHLRGSVLTQLLGSLAFVIVVMFLMDPALAAIALAPFPIAVLVQIRYAARTREADRRRRAEPGRGGRLGLRQRPRREADPVARPRGRARSAFDRAVEMLFAGWLRVGRLDAGYGAVLGALPYIGLGLVLAFGGRAVIDGRISLGEFVTFYAYGGMLAAAAAQITLPDLRDRRRRGLGRPDRRGARPPARADPRRWLAGQAEDVTDVGLRDVSAAHGAEPARRDQPRRAARRDGGARGRDRRRHDHRARARERPRGTRRGGS